MQDLERDGSDQATPVSDAEPALVGPGTIRVIKDSSQKVTRDGQEIIASGTILFRGETLEIIPFPRYPTGPIIVFIFIDDARRPGVYFRSLRDSGSTRGKKRSYRFPFECFNWIMRATVTIPTREVATYRGRKIMAEISSVLIETKGPTPLRRFHYTMFYADPHKA